MSHLMKKVGLIFDENKVKPFLKMSIQRIQLAINKKTNQIKVIKKEIARLLADGKEEKARIRVEQVIREDYTTQAYDILELHCELVAGRVRFLASQKDCPQDMEQAVCTIIWAADRADISELATVKTQFGKKYGAEFIRRAENDADGCVNRNVVEKLSCDPPGGYVITEYLQAIAEEYDVEYTPSEPKPRRHSHDEVPSTSTSSSSRPGAGPRPAYEHHSPPQNSDDDKNNRNSPSGGGGGGGSIGSPPPVTAWAVPSTTVPTGVPQAHATMSPEVIDGRPSAWGGGGAAAGGGMSGPPGGGGGEMGHYVDPVGKPSGHHGGAAAAAAGGTERRRSGGWDEAVKGWGPGKSGGGGGGAVGGGEGKVDDPPPPYTPYDIPSPPKNKPVSTRTFDIPAAPGYEDPPDRPTSGVPSAPDDGDDQPPPGAKDDADGSGGSNMDDLAARFANLRNF